MLLYWEAHVFMLNTVNKVCIIVHVFDGWVLNLPGRDWLSKFTVRLKSYLNSHLGDPNLIRSDLK